MLRSSAPLHLHPPKYRRPRPTKNIATLPIDRRRRRTNGPQDRRYCGPDQSIDSPGDGRPGLKPEGRKDNIGIALKHGQGADQSSRQSRLNIPDLPVGGFAAAPAAAAPAAAVEAEEEAPAAQEKTLFSVKLVKFEASAKPKVIKEVKNLLGLSLVDSKKFVESAPKLMKDSVPKDEAEKIVATLKELGATVEME